MNRRQAVCSLLSIATASWMSNADTPQSNAGAANLRWVRDVMVKMSRIKPGMTRADLLTVFTGEGGLTTGLQRTYVSQDCPFFKVDVTFLAVGRPARDKQGRVTLVEDDRDRIATLSRRYLAFSVMD